MTEKHSRFDVARAAFAIALTLPWILVTEAVGNVRTLGHRPVLLP